MIIDKLNTFASAVATGATGTRILGDVIDLGAASRDMGAGVPVYLNVVVSTGITLASSTGTYQVKLTSASNAALSSGNVDHVLSAAVATSTTAIPAGTVLLSVALPSATYGRYLGVQEVVTTTSTNAGAVNAFLSKDQVAYTAYNGER